MKLLAGLEISTKAVERTTESIGVDIDFDTLIWPPFDTLIWPHPTENHIPWTLLQA